MFQDDIRYAFNDLYDGIIREEDVSNRFYLIGEGEVYVRPDMAEVVIGVITENMDIKLAQEENTKISNSVIESIRQLGVDLKDIQTQDYNINIRNDYVDGKQVFRGYEVRNNLRVLVRDIDKIGEIIDTSVASGANNIGNIGFLVSDENKVYLSALKLAIKDAQDKAMVMAGSLNVRLDAIPIKITEQAVNRIAPMNAVYKASASAPIEAGQYSVKANIEAIFQYFK
ncbi:SIMPL domain-containing protein [Clostridium paridis]|uniref:SIMPL domain-containing protein n=1 Tax=Clostridium paridis TaxID=2803863 RepID=A0A937K4A1_9CLOT|nr:SIMPL domain-containing protein [Clostridium paridis]MBL4930975.1 SIMPL domain-containing protein [Clostridium paridis]